MRRSDEYEGNIRRISAIAPSASPRVRKSPTRTRQYGDWNVRYTRYCGRRAIRLRRLAVARDLAVRTLLSAKTSTRKPVPARGRDMPELSPAASSVAFERSCNSAGWVMCMCPELLSSRTMSTLSGSIAVAGHGSCGPESGACYRDCTQTCVHWLWLFGGCSEVFLSYMSPEAYRVPSGTIC